MKKKLSLPEDHREKTEELLHRVAFRLKRRQISKDQVTISRRGGTLTLKGKPEECYKAR